MAIDGHEIAGRRHRGDRLVFGVRGNADGPTVGTAESVPYGGRRGDAAGDSRDTRALTGIAVARDLVTGA